MDAFDELRLILQSRGIHALLRALKSRTPHRYAGVYRFDPPMLRNLCLCDAFTPEVTRGADSALSESYCAIVGSDERPLAFEDSRVEPQLVGHPSRESVISYCGVLIRDASGAPFGTICLFDSKPCEVPTSQLSLMERLAPYVHQAMVGIEQGCEAR